MQATCSTSDCTRATHSRGLCGPHYQRARRKGELPRKDGSWHRLSDVDIEAKTGTCSICGPTRVRIRKTRAHECYAQRQADYARPNRSSPVARRKRLLLAQYQLTVDEHDAMLAAQGGGCAICGAVRSGDGRHLAVDHCHTTGRIRGLLCTDCNRGIGMFVDDPERLRRAAEYLT